MRKATYTGTLTFADVHCLEAGIDAFAEVEGIPIELYDLDIRGTTITLEVETADPMTDAEFSAECRALEELARFARSGALHASSSWGGDRGDAGGRRSSRGLPPRHRRWEVYFAALRGDADAMRALVADGAPLSEQYARDLLRTPLQVASDRGHAAVVDVLIAAGVDVNAVDGDGATAIVLARTAAIAKRLVDAGADPSVRGGLAMSSACWQKRLDVAEVVLAAGVKISLAAGVRAVDALIRDGQLAFLHALIERRPTEMTRVLRASQVMAAAIHRDQPIVVDLLLEHGNKLPRTLLADALAAGSLPLVALALQDPGAVKRCGRSGKYRDAMCVAARRAQLAMMQLLAKHGVPLAPARSSCETSPLHQLAGNDHGEATACLDWLLAQGVPLDVVDQHGQTALEHASRAHAVKLRAASRKAVKRIPK